MTQDEPNTLIMQHRLSGANEAFKYMKERWEREYTPEGYRRAQD